MLASPACFSFVCVRMARLVRVALGSSAVANKKLETGNPLVILGVLVETNLVGATYVPPPEKLRQNDMFCSTI